MAASPGKTVGDEGTLSDSLRSRFNTSLQNRNTKKLLLKIEDSPTQKVVLAEETARGTARAQNMHDAQRLQRSATTGRKRKEVQIYTLSSVARPTTPSSYSTPNRESLPGLKRNKSLPLFLKTSVQSSLPSPQASESPRIRAQTISISTPGVPKVGGEARTWVYQKESLSSSSDDEGPYSFSDEFKDNAYPKGPLLVCGSNIFLYSEPTLEDVLKFDVVVNVAKEIPNFTSKLPSYKRKDYHHVNWTHTSKICDDLPYLTDIIHQADINNRKVLIHCQCGVSRSASLIVAYIMKYQDLSLNDAYNMLKGVAKDISPNMSLIFQLMEWNEKLRGKQHQTQTHMNINETSDGLNNSICDNSSTSLAPIHISDIVSQQNVQDLSKLSLSSPNCSSISTENTPFTPNEFLGSDPSPASSTGSTKLSTCTKRTLSTPYSPILETFSQSPVEVVGKK